MSRETPLRAERDENVVTIGEHRVVVAYDPDGELWYVSASSVPGLTASADELPELLDALPLLIRDVELP